MEPWLQIIIAIFASVLLSSGLWSYILNRTNRRDAKAKALMGLSHDRIMSLGMAYIERGYITQEEYENLYKYLYMPYKDLGGNGVAQRVMEEVKKLPIKRSKFDEEVMIRDDERQSVHRP